MLEITAVTITFVRTRPHPQLTFRSRRVTAVINFPIDRVAYQRQWDRSRHSGCWWGWAGSYEG